jgi:hypothetical protein
MEDRHTVSEPRPVTLAMLDKHMNPQGEGGYFGGGGVDPDDIVGWEVDVFRENVDKPVDTFLLNNSNLPPRKGKKGKIAWRLPEHYGAQVVSYMLHM